MCVGGGVKPPADSEEPPAEEEKPDDGTEPPAEGDKKPDDGTEPPTEEEKKPDDGTEPPTEEEKKPDDGTEPPAEEEKPNDSTGTLTEEEKKPDDGTEPPTEEEKPSDGTETSGEDDNTDSVTEGSGEPSVTESKDSGSENTAISTDGEVPASSDTADDTAAVGFRIETGSFVMPVYAAENPQDGVNAGTLTDSTDETTAPPADDTAAQTDTDTDTRVKSVNIGNVTWQSEPSYDGDTEGVYTFTPALPDSYTLADGVSLPEIKVTVDGTAALIQALLERIAALPDAQEYMEKEPDIDNWEGDADAYEEAYTEWMEGLQEYAGEALAIWEEYEALTEEQQAQMPEEELAKLAAWVEIAEQSSADSMVMAADTHTTHNGKTFTAWTSDTSLPTSGSYYLTKDVGLTRYNGITIGNSSTLNLCLNGKGIRLRYDGANQVLFRINSATLNLYDCDGSGGVSHSAYTSGVTAPDIIRINNGGKFNLYSGSIGGSSRVIAQDSSTVTIYGGTINCDLEAQDSAKVTIYGGTLKESPYAVEATGDATVTIAGDATLRYPIYTVNSVIASGTGVSGLSETIKIKYNNVANGTVVVTGSTDTTHYQLDSDTYGLVAKDGNLVAAEKTKIRSVTYEKNGGTIENESSYTSYVEGVGLTLPTPTKTGYTFGGWYGNSNCTGMKVTRLSDTATGDKTYYAKWTANIYTVTYDAKGGTIENESNYTSYTYGIGLTLPTPTRPGYTFGGWYEDSTCTGTKVTSISNTETGNKTYYAKWTANSYTVTFNTNGGGTAPASISVTYDSTYGTLVTVSRTGYSFDGWYTAASSGSKVESDTKVTTDGNHTLYAHWTAKTYNVTYNKNSGTIANESSYTKYTYGTGLTLPTPTRTGYTFGGWYENSNLTGTAVTSISTTATGAKTYYAKWTAATYTVTFNYQGATGGNGTTSKDVTYNGTYGELPTPEKTGYVFKGWYTQTEGRGSQITSTTTVNITDAQTLYAYWKDETAPAAPVLQSGITLPADWTRTQKTIPLTLSDNVAVTELLVKIDNGNYVKVSGFTGGSQTVAYSYAVTEGNHTYHFKAKDAAGNISLESEAFTVMLDTGAPVFSADPAAENVTSDSADITFTPSEGGKAYWIADPAGTPAGAQAVISGAQGSTDRGGVNAVTGGTSAVIPVTGLTPGAAHKVYVVLEDAAGNLSVVKEAAFATLPEAPVIKLDDLIKDYEKEKIKVPDKFGEVEVYTDPDDPSGSIIPPGADGTLPVEPGKPIYIRYPEKTAEGGVTVRPSEGVKIDIPARPAAPAPKQVTVTDTTVTVKDASDDEEYILVEKGSLPEGAEPDWNDAGQVSETGEFTGLTPNKEYELYVRKKATDDDFASEPAKTEVRTSVTINAPEATGDGAGKPGNTAPKPEKPDEGGRTVTYTGTYGEEYTPVIKVDGNEIIPGAGAPSPEGSEMVWNEEDKKGEWKYVYPIPEGATEAEITVEFRKRSITGITAEPDSLTLSADDDANRSAAEAGEITPLTAYLKEKCGVKASYDNRTTGTPAADAITYTTSETFAPKGQTYPYTISAGGKTCTATLTVMPVTASVRNPDALAKRQKEDGYTAQEAGAWLPAKLTVTYTGADHTARTQELAVAWDTASIGTDFGKTLGEKTVNGTVELPPWATGTASVSIVIRFVDKTPLGDSQIRLTVQDFRYGDKKLPDAQGSVAVTDTDPAYTYLYSTDGGKTWVTEENLPKSDGGYVVPGGYQVKLTYAGDNYTGEKVVSFTVAKKQLDILPGTLAVGDKNHDGTTGAVLKEGGEAALSGIVAGDKVTLGGTLEALCRDGTKEEHPRDRDGLSVGRSGQRVL